MAKRLSNNDITQEAISIVKNHVQQHEDAQFFITEKVSFVMRPLIRRLRKNYWGIFDDPKDPVTGKDKQWVPFTTLIVDTVRRNADLDAKDANFRSRTRRGIPITAMIRGFFRDWMHKTQFGEFINDTILQLCIDGTVVWKTIKKRQNGKTIIDYRMVDLLNCYIDPTADNIQAADFTERAVLRVSDVKRMDGWMNKHMVKASKNVHKVERDLTTTYQSGDFVDVYEFWGEIPKYLITGRKNKRKNEMIEGRIVVSGIDGSNPVLHIIEKNTDKDRDGNIIKPYEEVRFLRVPNRWYGRGPAEMVLQIQEWLNLIINLRIKKNTAAALGLFKIRSKSGITQQALSNLVSQGVISVNNMEDLENFPVNESGEFSYKDEEIAKGWGFEITSTNEVVRGNLPSSTTATTSVIEDRNSKTAFTLTKEVIGLFWQRWMDRHYLPHVPQMMKEAEWVRIYGDFEDVKQHRDSVVSYLAMDELEKLYKDGTIPTDLEVQEAINSAERKLAREGDLLVKVTDRVLTDDIDAWFFVTNEEMDIGVTVNNLISMSAQMAQGLTEEQRQTLAQGFDLLGLEPPDSLVSGTAQPTGYQPPQGQPQGQPTEQQLVTSANTLSNEQAPRV